jgi:hypothetical protein
VFLKTSFCYKKICLCYSAFTDKVEHSCHFPDTGRNYDKKVGWFYCFYGVMPDSYRGNLAGLGGESCSSGREPGSDSCFQLLQWSHCMLKQELYWTDAHRLEFRHRTFYLARETIFHRIRLNVLWAGRQTHGNFNFLFTYSVTTGTNKFKHSPVQNRTQIQRIHRILINTAPVIPKPMQEETEDGLPVRYCSSLTLLHTLTHLLASWSKVGKQETQNPLVCRR